MKTISKMMLAVVVLGGLAANVQATVISECASTRYAYMGGSVAAAGRNYMLVGDKAVSGWWGYAWLTFEAPFEAVDSAYLNLQSITQSAGMWATPETSPVVISVHAVAADVTAIGGAYTAAEFKSSIGEAVASVVVSGGDAIYSWEITDLVNSWIAGGTNYGLVLSIDGIGDGTTYAKFAGINNPAGIAPVITNAAMGIPEPATLVLLGTGAMLSGYLRRKH